MTIINVLNIFEKEEFLLLVAIAISGKNFFIKEDFETTFLFS